MSFWIWFGIWAAILAVTGVFYYQIFSTLRSKALRVMGQLEILLKTVEKLQGELAQKVTFEPEPSAIETGERIAIAERIQVKASREKAKQDRQRRLIKGLKNLQKERG